MNVIDLGWLNDEPGFSSGRWGHSGDWRTMETHTVPLDRFHLDFVDQRGVFGPVCGETYVRGMICSLPPDHECPHLACHQHIVKVFGLRTTRPRLTTLGIGP